MANEETIVNKIITVDTIVEIANYFEDKLEEYQRLYKEEIKKNQGLDRDKQVYKYKLYDSSKIQYEITFIDNKSLTQSDYNWFVGNLANPRLVKRINISYYLSYEDNSEDVNNAQYKTIHASITFHDDTIFLSVNGKETENETYNLHSTIRNILENNENRYNKTVKNRNFRIQSFCLSIGFVLSYILYLVLLGNKSNLPEILVQLMNNKYALVFGQWFVAAIAGNMVGYPIMMNFYRNIIPKTRYSHYSSSSHRSVYVDDVEDFVGHDEVQIGNFANNGNRRLLIEKIYKVTKIIVLIQLVLSIIFFLILK